MDGKRTVVLVDTIQGHFDGHAMETALTLHSWAERQSMKTLRALIQLLFQKVCSWWGWGNGLENCGSLVQQSSMLYHNCICCFLLW